MNTEKIKQKLTQVWKTVSLYSVILITFAVGIVIGYYYDFIKDNLTKTKPSYIKRKEINLAIDEKNNLLIVKKSDGTYTTYQDSVGYMIFQMYAKNIWGQASTNNTTSNESK